MTIGWAAMMVAPMRAAEPETSDEALVRRAIAGDSSAFGDLYTRYARVVHAILLARVPPADVEDLVQEVFLSAFRKLRLLRAPGAFRGWLGSIARNHAIDYHRAARPHDELKDSSATAAAPQAAGHEARRVLDTIRSLPEAYRETLILRLVEGFTGPEIAERTGLTHDSVRVNLVRGMQLLRAQLGGGAR